MTSTDKRLDAIHEQAARLAVARVVLPAVSGVSPSRGSIGDPVAAGTRAALTIDLM